MLTFIATIVALAALIAVILHDAYLVLLASAAKKRAGGEPVLTYVRSRWSVAGITTLGALLALLLASGNLLLAILAILLGLWSGTTALTALRATQQRFRNQ